jgi:excisionase family DNA binding protein
VKETYLRPSQVAARLNVAPETIVRWIKAGKLRGEQTKTGRWLIPGSEAERLLLQAQVDGSEGTR